MMRDMKKKINPRYSVSDEETFPTLLPFSLCLNLVVFEQSPAAVTMQELMPWDHPYLSGVLRAER